MHALNTLVVSNPSDAARERRSPRACDSLRLARDRWPVWLAAALAGPVAALVLPAAAQSVVATPAPMNVVSLTASATVEVPRDLLSVTFSTMREGADANAVQAQLKQALDAALAEARRAARPGEVDVQTGGFSLYPRYANRAGTSVVSGWQGTAELVVEGRDTQAIAALTGRIPTMTIARVGFRLSREAREKVENDVSAQAIERFRQRADFVTRQFGFGGYSVREVSLSTNDPGSGPVPMFRTQAARVAGAEEALPVEAGKAAVTATVSGSVTMSPGR